MSASKSHFDYCLFWRWGVKLYDCICISCTARKCLSAKTKISICISWIHTSVIKTTFYPDFSKVKKMPAKHLEIRQCYSLQHWQLKIFQQQDSSFYCKVQGKKKIWSLVLFGNKNVKREISQNLDACSILDFDIELSWPLPLPPTMSWRRMQCGVSFRKWTVVCLLQEIISSIFITNETLNPLSLNKSDTKQIKKKS